MKIEYKNYAIVVLDFVWGDKHTKRFRVVTPTGEDTGRASLTRAGAKRIIDRLTAADELESAIAASVEPTISDLRSSASNRKKLGRMTQEEIDQLLM